MFPVPFFQVKKNFGARFIALWKIEGDVRPIAVGDVLRRAAAKGVVRVGVTEAVKARFLTSGQVAIGIKDGMGAAVCAVRRYAARACAFLFVLRRSASPRAFRWKPDGENGMNLIKKEYFKYESKFCSPISA